MCKKRGRTEAELRYRRTGGQQDWWTDRQLHSSWQAPGIWASQHPSGLLSASSPPHFHFHLPIHLHIHIHIHDHVHIHLQLHGIVCPDSCSLTKWPLWALECTNLVQLCLAHLPATGRWKVKGGLGADAAHSALHWGKWQWQHEGESCYTVNEKTLASIPSDIFPGNHIRNQGFVFQIMSISLHLAKIWLQRERLQKDCIYIKS